MLLGHYGVAFALKRAEPKVSLGTLFIAVQLVDLAWSACILLGWESARIVPDYTAVSPFEFLDYPLTHSLLAGAIWAVAAGALYYSWPTTDTARHARAAAVVGAAVLSHWFLDALVHVPDLPLAGGASPKVGLGLWHSLPATLAVEAIIFFGGLALYLTQPAGRRHPVARGRAAIVAGLLASAYVAETFGAPPPSMRAAAIGGIVFFIVAGFLGVWANQRSVPVTVTAH